MELAKLLPEAEPGTHTQGSGTRECPVLTSAAFMGMRVGATPDATGRMEKFTELVKSLVEQHDVQQLKDLVDGMLAEESSFALFARPVLQQVAEQMEKLKNTELKELALHTLDRLRGRVVSFEEEDFVIRELLSEVFQAECDWAEAAKCLAAINLESGTRCRTPMQKAEKYVKVAELYLEDDDPISADTFCSRAAMVMHEVNDTPLQLRYRVCHVGLPVSPVGTGPRQQEAPTPALSARRLGQNSVIKVMTRHEFNGIVRTATGADLQSSLQIQAPGRQRIRAMPALAKHQGIYPTSVQSLKRHALGDARDDARDDARNDAGHAPDDGHLACMNPMMAMMAQMASMGSTSTNDDDDEPEPTKDEGPVGETIRKGKGKGKRAPNAEHCLPTIHPEVEALCKKFNIEDKIVRRLDDVMRTREASFEED
ncbi:CSN4 [Symbiodinium natans]|uniref:CSN4 protein n=1 Tax=Symbiodinium natans TaxID=878477 RepID=A0A812MBI1_9DINO|nr:CSN4 [Symbiodinium natans]